MSAHRTDEIRREMAVLRGQLHSSAGAARENARVLADWRYYVRRFPWPCLSVAALAGFFLVPRRLELITQDTAALLDMAEEDRVQIESKPTPLESGPQGVIAPLLINAVVRGGLALVGQQAGKLFASLAERDETSRRDNL